VLIDGFPHGHGNFLANNSFSLRPGESRAIAIELRDDEQSLAELSVRAWNADRVACGAR